MRDVVHPLARARARVLVALVIACLLAGVGSAPAHAASRAADDEAGAQAAVSPQLEPAPWLPLPSGADEADVVGGALLVTTSTPAGTAVLDGLAVDGARAEVLADGVTRITVDPAVAEATREALAARPGVVAVETERVWELFAAVPNDPGYRHQWAHTATNAPRGWSVTTGSPQRRIAVIDSGIDGRHPDLAPIAHRYVVASVNGSIRLTSGPVDNDTCGSGHGTGVAGVAAARGNNGQGVTGVAWNAELIDIAVTSAGDCSVTDGKVIRGLQQLTGNRIPGARADVVNLSLGGLERSGRCPAALQKVIDQVVAQGTVVVAAAGNHGTIGYTVPAACRGVIAVGATEPSGARARYSAMARYLDLSAPGGAAGCGKTPAARCILTTTRLAGSGKAPYGALTGTSFAAPYVAGMVSLLRTQRPGLSPAQIEGILELTARHPGGPGTHDHEHGWGVVDVGRALEVTVAGQGIPSARREHPAIRLAAGSPTAPIPQAVAISRMTFPDHGAAFAVIARDDNFADALAGSSLAFGVGPLLFAKRRGPLSPATAAELTRTLAPGDTVYLLGGEDALDLRLESDVKALGLSPRRIKGSGRVETAVAVARELARAVRGPASAVLVATASNWPDAVAAGSLGATFGFPILLTTPNTLHESTRSYLTELAGAGARPAVYVVGGTGVISKTAADSARAAATRGGGPDAALIRLAGGSRDQTADAVALELRRQLRPDLPPFAIAVELDRADGYAHALSASALAGATASVFVPVRGAVSSPRLPARLSQTTAAAFCGWGGDAVLAGGPDLLPDHVGRQLVEVLSRAPGSC